MKSQDFFLFFLSSDGFSEDDSIKPSLHLNNVFLGAFTQPLNWQNKTLISKVIPGLQYSKLKGVDQ